MSYHVVHPLYLLSCLDGFKMYRDNGDLLFEAEGVCFNASCLCLEEAVLQAYIFIQARIEARELVKKAKIQI